MAEGNIREDQEVVRPKGPYDPLMDMRWRVVSMGGERLCIATEDDQIVADHLVPGFRSHFEELTRLHNERIDREQKTGAGMKTTFWTVDGKWWERGVDEAGASNLVAWGRPFKVFDPRHDREVWLNPAAIVHYRVEEDDDG